ncbi:unnamed protein product, partial [Rotaria sordida]
VGGGGEGVEVGPFSSSSAGDNNSLSSLRSPAIGLRTSSNNTDNSLILNSDFPINYNVVLKTC